MLFDINLIGISYAPFWYALKDRNNMNINMEVHLTYWMGTQVDVEFTNSWIRVAFLLPIQNNTIYQFFVILELV